MPDDPIPCLILVDTSAYFGLCDKPDRQHLDAVTFVRMAQALLAHYPRQSEEKRLLDAMLLAVPR